MLRKNFNSNINKLLNDFKNDISIIKIKPEKQKLKIKKENNTSLNININYNNLKTNPNENFQKINQLSISKKSKSKEGKNKRNKSKNSIFNNSNTSLLSTMKNSNYYMKESEELTKYIKDYYNKNKEYPKTDLLFYKFGRIIGRGEFGKVNLGLNTLTRRVLAIKSFNKENIKNEYSMK